MKKTIIMLAFTSIVMAIKAQEEWAKPEQKTFFGDNEKPSLRGFIGFKNSGFMLDNQFGDVLMDDFEGKLKVNIAHGRFIARNLNNLRKNGSLLFKS